MSHTLSPHWKKIWIPTSNTTYLKLKQHSWQVVLPGYSPSKELVLQGGFMAYIPRHPTPSPASNMGLEIHYPWRRHGTRYILSLWTDWLTHSLENITFKQLIIKNKWVKNELFDYIFVMSCLCRFTLFAVP